MLSYINIFGDNFENFKKEIHLYLEILEMPFNSSSLVFVYNIYINDTTYFFIKMEYLEPDSKDFDEGVSLLLYPANFVFGDYSNCLDIEKSYDLLRHKGEISYVGEIEGYLFQFSINDENRKVLKNLNDKLANLILEKLNLRCDKKIQKRINRLHEVDKQIFQITSFIDDIFEGSY